MKTFIGAQPRPASNLERGTLVRTIVLVLAGDAEQLSRFIAETGLAPDAFRRSLDDPGFQSGVLDYVASNQDLLAACAAKMNMTPDRMWQTILRLGSPPMD